MDEIYSKEKTADQYYDESPRLQLRQLLYDHSRNEEVAVGTILHRCNHLYQLVNKLMTNEMDGVDHFTQHSYEMSMENERSEIMQLINLFRETKLKNTEQQNAALKLLEKSIKKHTSLKTIQKLRSQNVARAKKVTVKPVEK